MRISFDSIFYPKWYYLIIFAPRAWVVHYDWSDGQQHSLGTEVNVTVFKIALSVDYLLNWQFDVRTLIFVTPPSFLSRFLILPLGNSSVVVGFYLTFIHGMDGCAKRELQCKSSCNIISNM